MNINMFKFIGIALVVSTLFVTNGFSQATQSNVLDGVYKKHIVDEKEIIPYEHIREADVSWQRRIWRTIDINEKLNLAFKYPRLTLIEIIHEAAKAGELTVYDPMIDYADEFLRVMPLEDVQGIGAGIDTELVVNEITFEEEWRVDTSSLQWIDITKFRVKEDWFFDKETSTLMVRILGIAPIKEEYDENDVYIGDLPIYWIYYPDLRNLLVKYEAFNPHNDAVRMSWEDIFEMRMFSSYIIKESNIHDRRIKDYSTGIDAIFESERIRKFLFQTEHQLWSF